MLCGASLAAQLVKNLPAMPKSVVRFLSWEDPLEKGQAIHSSVLGLRWWLKYKESACNAGDLGSTPGLGRYPGRGHGNRSSTLAWRIPWTEEPGGYSPWGHKDLDRTEQVSTVQHIHYLQKTHFRSRDTRRRKVRWVE